MEKGERQNGVKYRERGRKEGDRIERGVDSEGEGGVPGKEYREQGRRERLRIERSTESEEPEKERAQSKL